MKTKTSLIAIDPGSREIGVAQFIGSELTDFGVKSLRRAGYLNAFVLKRAMKRLFEEKNPEVLAIEKNNFAHVSQNKAVMHTFRIITKMARKRGIQTFEFAPNTVKKEVAGDGRATKRTLSKVVCSKFPFLRPFRDTGRIWKDRYHQNMYDAVAVGLTYLKLTEQNRIAEYESHD